MKYLSKIFGLGVCAVGAIALSSCGDDVITQNAIQGFDRVDEISEASCNAKNEGKLVYETSSKTSFICNDEKWVNLDTVKNANSYCITRSLKDKSGVEIVCNDSVVGRLTNGVAEAGESDYSCKLKKSSDGKKIEIECGGKVVGSVKNGNDGNCCSVKDVKDKKTGATGYEMTCGSGDNKTVGTIWNGTNGLVGEGCRISKEDTYIMEVTCGSEDNKTVTVIYKNICGGDSYNPDEQFCFNGRAYDYCDGNDYNPLIEYCEPFGSADGKRDSVWILLPER